MKRTILLMWGILLVGLVGSGCGKSSGNGDNDAGTDGSVGDDGGFSSPVLDPDFGDNGILRVQSTWSLDEIYAADLTADGDLLVGGTTVGLGHRSQPLIARFTSDGAPDPSFGSGGFVPLPLFEYSVVTGVVALPDGGAVVAGWGWFDAGLAFAIRVDGQGGLDPTFGDGGVAIWESSTRHVAADVDSTGRVVLLLEASGDAEIRRFTADGVLDASFGSGGVVSVMGEDPRDLVVLDDDRILALTHENGSSWVVRLTASGDSDSTFGPGGFVGADLEAFDLAVHFTTGALLVAGNDDTRGQVLKFDADGAPDPAFGTAGVADATPQEQLMHVEWLPSGDILVLDARHGTFPSGRYEGLIRLGADGQPLPFDTTTADQHSNANVAAMLVSSTGVILVGDERLAVDTPADADIEIALLGMNHDGSPLSGFGQAGRAHAGSKGPSEVVWDMGVLSDGAQIVVGSAGVDPILVRFAGGGLDTTYGTGGIAYGYPSQIGRIAVDDADRILGLNWSTCLVRFLADGTQDQTFGPNGHAEMAPGQIRNVAVDLQQRIVVCGWEANAEMPMIARYNSDGFLDSSFGTAGAVLDLDGNRGFAAAVHVDPDGKIVIAGERFPPMAFPELILARVNDDGSVDTTFGQGGVTAIEASAGANRILSRSGGGYLLVNHSPYNDPLQIIATDASGQLDPGFGQGGIVTLEEPMEWPVVGLLELDDGRILVGGGVVNGNAEQLAVWCLQPDGQLDTDFAEDGVFLLPGMGRATALVPDGDGVLVGGFLFHPDSGTDVALLRLLP